MATLKIINLTAADVPLDDTGIFIPASGEEAISDQALIFKLISASKDLRTKVNAGVLKLNDGTVDITILDLYDYWMRAGFNRESLNPRALTYLKSPDGSTWKLEVDNTGILITTKVV